MFCDFAQSKRLSTFLDCRLLPCKLSAPTVNGGEDGAVKRPLSFVRVPKLFQLIFDEFSLWFLVQFEGTVQGHSQ